MVLSGAVVLVIEVIPTSAGGVVRDSAGVKGKVVGDAPIDGVELDGPSRGVATGVSIYGMLSFCEPGRFLTPEKGEK